MIIFQYIINILVIFILATVAYFCTVMLKSLLSDLRIKKQAYNELRELVSKTTPAKDEQLRKEYSGNRKALKIIENATKEKNKWARLHKVSKKAIPYTEKVKRMDRREQIVTQLEYKRALRTGEVDSKEAKIIEFIQETPQTKDSSNK